MCSFSDEEGKEEEDPYADVISRNIKKKQEESREAQKAEKTETHKCYLPSSSESCSDSAWQSDDESGESKKAPAAAQQPSPRRRKRPAATQGTPSAVTGTPVKHGQLQVALEGGPDASNVKKKEKGEKESSCAAGSEGGNAEGEEEEEEEEGHSERHELNGVRVVSKPPFKGCINQRCRRFCYNWECCYDRSDPYAGSHLVPVPCIRDENDNRKRCYFLRRCHGMWRFLFWTPILAYVVNIVASGWRISVINVEMLWSYTMLIFSSVEA